MRKTIFVLCIVVAVFYYSPTFASGPDKFYLELELGRSHVDFDSGGYNTWYRKFPNTGDDHTLAIVPGIHFGREFFRVLRADISLNYRSDLGFRTNSFEPPRPTFFYETDVDSYTGMFSIYLEPLHYKKWTPYVGGGVGLSRIKIKTDDTVVTGKGSETGFSWQAEGGIRYALTEHFSLRLGYRYIDMGSIDIDLNRSGFNAGNFEANLAGHEIVFGIGLRF
jgi:opacity protein-like surface antigen